MNNNWFEIEQMARSRQHDLLKEAADLRRAEAMRQARSESARLTATPSARPVAAVTVAARVGGVLVAIGRRLQGASVLADDASTCGVCGRDFPGLGPLPRA